MASGSFTRSKEEKAASALRMIPVRAAMVLMITSRIFAPGTVRSFFAGNGERTDISTAMNVRISPVRMLIRDELNRAWEVYYGTTEHF